MLQENVRYVYARGFDGLTTNRPVGNCQSFRALDFNHRPENRSQALEVVNSNFGQGAYAAIVIPPRPCRTCIAIQAAGRVDSADCPLLDAPPKRPKRGCKLHEG